MVPCIEPPVGPVYALEEFAAALEAGFAGKSLGKVVVRVDPACR